MTARQNASWKTLLCPPVNGVLNIFAGHLWISNRTPFSFCLILEYSSTSSLKTSRSTSLDSCTMPLAKLPKATIPMTPSDRLSSLTKSSTNSDILRSKPDMSSQETLSLSWLINLFQADLELLIRARCDWKDEEMHFCWRRELLKSLKRASMSDSRRVETIVLYISTY